MKRKGNYVFRSVYVCQSKQVILPSFLSPFSETSENGKTKRKARETDMLITLAFSLWPVCPTCPEIDS